jgi:hypothetical protein
MRLGSILVVIWLLIGVAACVQRGYFRSGPENCSSLGTTVAAAVAGPLNYLGANPKVRCSTPRPSR